ncbi:MAG: co-chaperone DjlA [Halieaceae bacterium]|nr:co-chaperone DjlA [Halieaceae bacterium]
MFFGKLIAGLIGYQMFGIPGLLFGLLIGSMFDRGLSSNLSLGNPQQLEEIRQLFFECCFSLLGHIAKADGRVTQEEVSHAEQVMTQLGVSGAQRGRAIDYFKAGAAPDFQPEPLLARFREASRRRPQLQQTLLLFLITMAQADGDIDDSEMQVLRACAAGLGFGDNVFLRLVQMAQAQQRFHQHQRQPQQQRRDLEAEAYRALGVNPGCSDRDLKKAYRRLMSENHPDKLIAQGVPEAMVKLATEKAQKIQSAYETLRKSRKQAAV